MNRSTRVGEEERADAVVVLHRREGEKSGELGHQVALGQVSRPEGLRARRGRGEGGRSDRAPRRTS